MFDISGYVTGFGNPDWARTHAPATSTAPAVASLLQARATCVGKTVMDEMAYSFNGENCHYGTPTNPCAPGRVPGGSSSGSAVAVAAGLVDFSLGTDTTGSIRVPAAYCGFFGFRPSHDTVSTSNVIPMAQSFDTNYGVLAIPTVPGPPPEMNLEAVTLEEFRKRAFCLLSIAGMSRFCQVTVPLGLCNNLPISISLMAIHGSDHFSSQSCSFSTWMMELSKSKLVSYGFRSLILIVNSCASVEIELRWKTEEHVIFVFSE